MKKFLPSLFVGAAIATASTVSAATALIDFSAANGATGLVGSNQWNSLNGTASSNTLANASLVDTSNNAFGNLSLTFSGAAANCGWGGTGVNPGDTAATGKPAFLLDGGGAVVTSAATDGIYANNGGASFATLSFSGLLANTQYDFIVYGGRDSSWTAGTAHYAITTGTSGSSFYDTATGSAGNRTALQFSVTSTGAGDIAFTFAEGGGASTADIAGLNALSMTAVPEPSTCGLLGAGTLALAAAVRRRRRLAGPVA